LRGKWVSEGIGGLPFPYQLQIESPADWYFLHDPSTKFNSRL